MLNNWPCWIVNDLLITFNSRRLHYTFNKKDILEFCPIESVKTREMSDSSDSNSSSKGKEKDDLNAIKSPSETTVYVQALRKKARVDRVRYSRFPSLSHSDLTDSDVDSVIKDDYDSFSV